MPNALKRRGGRALWAGLAMLFALAILDPCPPALAAPAEATPVVQAFCPCHATDGAPASTIAGDVLAPPPERVQAVVEGAPGSEAPLPAAWPDAPRRLPEPVPIAAPRR